MTARLRRKLLMASVVALLGGFVLMACGGVTPASRQVIRPLVTSSSAGLLSWHDLPEPEVADTTVGLLFAWVVSPLGLAPVHEELARIDRTTGQVQAERELQGSFLNAVAASHSLFVTTRTSTGEVLLRLDPRTLGESGDWQLRGGGPGFFGRGSMAVAGGGLWLTDGDRLDRFSLSHKTMTASIVLPGAASSDVTTDATGSVLVVGEADEGGLGRIERRDPVTGALLGVSSPVEGIVDPYIEGVVGDDMWITEATGTMGFTELYDLTDLAPVGPPCNEGVSNSTCLVGTNDIDAELSRGLLWVAQVAGGPARNFCGNPDGSVLATLPLQDDDNVLAIGSRDIFLLTPQYSADKGETFTEEPIPAACRPET